VCGRLQLVRKPALHLAVVLTLSLLVLGSAASIINQQRTRHLLSALQSMLRDQDSRLAELGLRLQRAQASQARDFDDAVRRLAASHAAAAQMPPPLPEPSPPTPAQSEPARPSTAEAAPSFARAGAQPAQLLQAEASEAASPQGLFQTAPQPGDPEPTPAAGPAAEEALPHPAPPALPGEQDAVPDAEMAKGLRCFRDGRYAQAAAHFSAILDRRPEDTTARHYYAVSLYRANPAASRRYAQIERHLLCVVAEQPDNWEAQEVLGLVLMESGRWAEALERLRRALALRPEDLDDLRMAGLCALYAGDPAAAEQHLLRASAIGAADAELWYLLAEARSRGGRLEAGRALLMLGRHQEALENLREYVAARPNAPGYAALGDCLQALGQVREAEEAIAAARALEGRQP
jgi:tetratricopeptide (TPR) repeat protein